MKFQVLGEYPYMRVDETGAVKEHSVDLHARHFFGDLGWVDFNLLVECKYNNPGCSWVFVPGHMTGHGFGGAASLHEDLCPIRTADHNDAVRQLWAVNRGAPHSMKGVALRGKDADAKAIEHGISQLRYAVPHVLSQALGNQAWNQDDSQVQAVVLCPILVTNAPLLVLKPNATVEKVQTARRKEDVARAYSSVRVAQAQGPDLRAYTQRIMSATMKSSGVLHRLADARTVMLQQGADPLLAPTEWRVAYAVECATEVVLVVHIAHLKRLVRRYMAVLSSMGKELVHYATLVSDPPDSAARFKPAEGRFPKSKFDQLAETIRGKNAGGRGARPAEPSI